MLGSQGLMTLWLYRITLSLIKALSKGSISYSSLDDGNEHGYILLLVKVWTVALRWKQLIQKVFLVIHEGQVELSISKCHSEKATTTY